MTEELKLRVKEIENVEKHLRDKAEMEKEVEAKDTYFDNDSQVVLKIREDDSGKWFIRYKPTEEGFEKVTEEEIENIKEFKEQLGKKHGIKSVLDKDMAFYSWKEYTVIVNRIRNVGDFLIIEGEEQPEKEFVEEELNLENPEHITVPFSDLEK